MKNLKGKVILLFGLTLLLCVGGATKSEATTAYPHPYYWDEWNYGTSGNFGWSYYSLKANVRVGSTSAIKNMRGTLKASARRDYGEARSEATKAWNDFRLDAFCGWYNF